MKMYDPMYNVKFCKIGMKYAREALRASLDNEMQKFDDIKNENVYPQPQYVNLIMPFIVEKRLHKQRVKIDQVYRAVCSVDNGYERRRDAIAEARVAYENAINEAV